jgi:hypothetical protein
MDLNRALLVLFFVLVLVLFFVLVFGSVFGLNAGVISIMGLLDTLRVGFDNSALGPGVSFVLEIVLVTDRFVASELERRFFNFWSKLYLLLSEAVNI